MALSLPNISLKLSTPLFYNIHAHTQQGIGGGQLTLAQVNSREELHSMFPGANEEALDQLLEATK